jgi:hypothetical protein
MSHLNATETASTDSESLSRRRIILLGASNVVLGWRTIFPLARSLAGEPIDIWGAFGHGRSYGIKSRVLGRSLPGIATCGLWPNLAGSPARQTVAVVTDLGNDLLYGVDVPQIIGWVNWCVERLREQNARVVITRLPLASVRRLSPARFRFMRSVLFPRSEMTLTTVIRLAEELDAALVELATRFGIAVVEPRPEWYGFDPIHVLRRQRHAAWSEIIGRGFGRSDFVLPAAASPPRMPRLWQLAPERRGVFGVETTRTQPVVELADGGRVFLF